MHHRKKEFEKLETTFTQKAPKMAEQVCCFFVISWPKYYFLIKFISSFLFLQIPFIKKKNHRPTQIINKMVILCGWG